jgi:hypothetical protein
MTGRAVADWVAVILAAGISLSLLAATIATAYIAIYLDRPVGENVTQILTGWGGGIIGILGAFVGYAFGKKANGDSGGAKT